MTKLADLIVKRLASPSEWEWDSLGYTLRHKSGIEIWHGTLPIFVEIYMPYKVKFNLIDQFRIWRAMRPFAAPMKAKQQTQKEKRVRELEITLEEHDV